jgi:hypothetical protein
MPMQPVMRTMQEQEQFIHGAMNHIGSAASHSVVGRTQRLVRERATENQSQRRKLRALWIPLLVCSAMIIMIAHSAWTLVEQWSTQFAGTDILSVTSTPLLLLTLWFVPLTMGVVVMILFSRGRSR